MCKGENLEHVGCEHDANVVEGIVQGATQGANQIGAGQIADAAQGMGQVDQVPANQSVDEYFMRLALEQAQKAFDLDEVPIGAIVVRDVSSSEAVCKGVPETPAAPSQENGFAQESAAETFVMFTAQNALELSNTPVPQNTEIIAVAFNRREIDADPASHAEFLAIELAAKKLKRWRLSDCSVYVTLEPCLMCAGLMHQARIKRCVYGAKDPKAGALGSLYNVHEDTRLNHRFQVENGVLGNECSALLKSFFAQLRQKHSLQ